MVPGSPRGPSGRGTSRDAGASRWSPAHQRVPQKARPDLRERGEAFGDPHDGQRTGPHACRGRQQQGGDGRRGTGQGPGGNHGDRHGRIGAVQQPGHRQPGKHVDGGHGGGSLMPGRSVPLGRHRMSVHHVTGMTAVAQVVRRRAVPAAGEREHQMQHALCGERAADDRGERETAAGSGPDHGELSPRQQCHKPPRNRPVGHRVVAQGGKYAAGQGEQPGPDAGDDEARGRPAGTALQGNHLIAPIARPSVSPRSQARLWSALPHAPAAGPPRAHSSEIRGP